MAQLSELLQVPHHTCALGSKVERPFLSDVALGLGLASPGSYRNKDALLDAIHGLLFGVPVPPEDHSVSGTITDAALQRLINGIRDQNLQKVSLTDGAPAARIAVAIASAPPTDQDPTDAGDPFDPLAIDDERKTALRSVTVRSGQGAFRDALLRAYDGRCAITACDVPEVLEAAHIRPYKGVRTNVVTNGILLRADLHRLWDTGRLAVHEASFEVLLDSDMIGSDYSLLAGEPIRVPTKSGQHPSAVALQQQREWAGL
jgi:hypothetical protein